MSLQCSKLMILLSCVTEVMRERMILKVWPRKGSKGQKREKLRTEQSAEKEFNNKEIYRIYQNEFYRPRLTSVLYKIKNVKEQKMKNANA